MPTEMRFCRECREVTAHVLVNGRDVTAHLCQRCLLQWASQLEAEEKAKGTADHHPRRRTPNGKARHRSKT